MKRLNRKDIIIIGVGFLAISWIIIGIIVIEQHNIPYVSSHIGPTTDAQRIATSKDIKEFKYKDQKIEKSSASDDLKDECEEYLKEYAIDEDAYYAENGKILDSYNVYDSKKVQTEKEAIEDIRSRNLTSQEVEPGITVNTEQVWYEYDMDGNLNEGMASETSNKKHPMYQTGYYSAETENMYIIESVNGSIVVNPLNYNLEYNEPGIPTIITESNVITGYGSESGKFYETIPNEDVLHVIVVDRIDGKFLNSLTNEQISKM